MHDRRGRFANWYTRWIGPITWLMDVLWPHLPPTTDEERSEEDKSRREWRKRDEACVGNISDKGGAPGEEILAACEDYLRAEEERGKGAEARLTTMVGMASVAAAATFGSVALLVRQENPPTILAVISLYVVSQIVCALLSAVAGLERSTVAAVELGALVRKPGESENEYFERAIGRYISRRHELYAINTRKISQMAVAHRAFKNFSVGILLLAVVATGLVLLGPTGAGAGQGRVEATSDDARRTPFSPKRQQLEHGRVDTTDDHAGS